MPCFSPDIRLLPLRRVRLFCEVAAARLRLGHWPPIDGFLRTRGHSKKKPVINYKWFGHSEKQLMSTRSRPRCWRCVARTWRRRGSHLTLYCDRRFQNAACLRYAMRTLDMGSCLISLGFMFYGHHAKSIMCRSYTWDVDALGS